MAGDDRVTVTVIIPAYNAEKHLGEGLNIVLAPPPLGEGTKA